MWSNYTFSEKKQVNKKSSGDGGYRQGGGGWAKFEKGGLGNIGGEGSS